MVKKKVEPCFISGYGENEKFRLSWGSLENPSHNKLLMEIDEEELMNLEKKRLGISPNKLVFIGMANLSKYYWCGWQYYLKAKREEVIFFASYFADRLGYSKELGLLKNIPKTPRAILRIGDNIRNSQIQELLSKTIRSKISKNIKKKISQSLKEETDPLSKGRYYETLHGENYPTIRWNFRYKDIVLVGVPDGITDDFVYEFKYTRKNSYIKQTLITAACQADVYGYYFQRPKRRIQIFCEEEDKIHTFIDDIDKQKVIDLLEKWIDMINGNLPMKPLSWKCNKCEFRGECVLLKDNKNAE